jgi:hypothetical protein
MAKPMQSDSRKRSSTWKRARREEARLEETAREKRLARLPHRVTAGYETSRELLRGYAIGRDIVVP